MSNSNGLPNEIAEFSLKLLLIGDSTVGKSSLLVRYCESTFSKTYVSTIGIDFKVKYTNIDGKSTKIQIWDTAGQESSVPKWMKIIESETDKQAVPVVLIGNKTDLVDRRVVASAEAEQLAKELSLPYFETSAVTGENVDNAFTCLASQVLRNMQNVPRPVGDSVRPSASTQSKPSNCAC